MKTLSQTITDIFRDEMKLATIGPDDNFFDLGGDSLMAENIVIALQALSPEPLQTAILLSASTPNELAAFLERRRNAAAAKSLVTKIPGGVGKTPVVMVHGMSGSPLFANRFTEGVKARCRLYAIRGYGLAEGEVPITDADEIVDLYLEGAKQAAGGLPDIYGGICVGGLIALEMGRRAHERTGRRIRLVLIDPPPIGSVWLKPVSGRVDAEERKAAIRRQLSFWTSVKRLTGRFGLARSFAGRKALRERFKKSLTLAFSGFAPTPYPCDILLLASSQWGAATVSDYEKWLPRGASIETVVLPGEHEGFQTANRAEIDAAIARFLDPVAADARAA